MTRSLATWAEMRVFQCNHRAWVCIDDMNILCIFGIFRMQHSGVLIPHRGVRRVEHSEKPS